MIDLGSYNKCICQQYNSIPPECNGQYIFRDSGKQVQLQPDNARSKVFLIAIDNCLIAGGRTKCDCLFLYKKDNDKRYTFLVELKGKGDIPKAFRQLSITRESDEYKNITNQFKPTKGGEKFVIISDIQLNTTELRKMEDTYKIRVGQIVHSDPRSPIPDLKDKLK